MKNMFMKKILFSFLLSVSLQSVAMEFCGYPMPCERFDNPHKATLCARQIFPLAWTYHKFVTMMENSEEATPRNVSAAFCMAAWAGCDIATIAITGHPSNYAFPMQIIAAAAYQPAVQKDLRQME